MKNQLVFALRGATLCGTLAAVLASGCEGNKPTSKESAAPAATKAEPKKAAAPAAMQNPKGTVRTVSADANLLNRPTTGTFVGTQVWVAIGQLTELFGNNKPKLPFRAVSVDLATGAASDKSIELPGPEFYPEGITAAADGTVYIGSITQGTVLKVAPGTTKALPFVSTETTHRGVIGLTVDEKRKLLWLCDTNPKAEEKLKGGALVGVALSNGKEVARHTLPKAGDKAPFCNDVVVGSEGDLWITELIGGRIFRVPAADALKSGEAKAWATGGPLAPPEGKDCCGPNGLEFVGEKLVVANSGRGTLVALDPKSKTPDADAKIIALTDEKTNKPMTLCSPDGLARVPGSKNKFIVVENGGCDAKTPRVVEVTLN